MTSKDSDVNMQANLESEHALEDEIVEEGELSSEEILEGTILFALEQAGEQLEQSGEVEPFTILINGEELNVEGLMGETEEEFYAEARRSVFQMEKISNAYVFCYDGFVDLDSGESDALIVEFANKGDENAQVIVRLYKNEDDNLEIEETLYHVGETETLFGSTLEQIQGGKAANEEDGAAGELDSAAAKTAEPSSDA